ncbi:MAG: SDR family NAD(P)-dependent oxidoreductase [Nanoarchaeota archaeon]|nr:SDR family NAD(P)-dependent oxidoreductase [Nanoarchaeota archaeon]
MPAPSISKTFWHGEVSCAVHNKKFQKLLKMKKETPLFKGILSKKSFSSEGYHTGIYKFSLQTKNKNLPKTCFIFPGQGSAFPGMFKEEYFRHKIVRDMFEIVDDFARQRGLPKPSAYILASDTGINYISQNMSLFTIECALAKIMELHGIVPYVVTGHSFGEFAALVVSGIIPFEEVLEIVYHRDAWCPEPGSIGSMIAINADKKTIKKILSRQKYYFSNINSLSQIVISSAAGNIGAITKVLEEKNTKFKVLEVPHPYHTPLLYHVKNNMEKFLRTKHLKTKKPNVLFFSSVSKRIVRGKPSSREIESIVSRQIVTPVDFIHQVKKIHALGAGNFIEVGPGDILCKFVKEILGKKANVFSAQDRLNSLIDSKSKFNANHANGTAAHNSRVIEIINSVIRKVTGYEIERISLQDRFGEDLGIDSIKKTEIIFTVLEESKIPTSPNINLSSFQRVGDLADYLGGKAGVHGKKERPLTAVKGSFKRYFIALKQKPINPIYFGTRQESMTVEFDDFFLKNNSLIKEFFSEPGQQRKGIIVLCDSGNFDFAKESFNSFKSSLNTVQEFIDFFKNAAVSNPSSLNANIIFVTHDQISPFIAGIISFFKSLKKEFPWLHFKHVHFDGNEKKERMIGISQKELLEPSDIEVVYKEGARHVQELNEIKKNGTIRLDSKSVVVAVGGAKGITFSLVKNISRLYKPNIFIVGRSKISDKDVMSNIRLLSKENPRISYQCADMSDYHKSDSLFKTILKKHKRISLIINGAGIERSSLLVKKSKADILDEIKNKVMPAFNILSLSLKYRPERVINFSSIVSKFGNRGQTVYSCSNEIVNSLTSHFNRVSDASSAVSINWPPWHETGMTAKDSIMQALKEMRIALLDPSQANRLFLQDNASIEEIIYFDKKDYERYFLILQNLAMFRPIIGDVQPNYEDLCFLKRLSLDEDRYLADHEISGVAYLPAAVSLVMMLCAASLELDDFPSIRNFAIRNPIILRGNEVLLETELKKHNNVMACRIKNSILFNSAIIEKGRKSKNTKSFDIPKKIVDVSVYGDGKFFHGPSFQAIDRVLAGNNGNLVIQVRLSKLPNIFNEGQFGRIAQLIDASFQSLAIKSMKNHDGLSLPVKVSRLIPYFQTPLTDLMYILPSIKGISSDYINGNAIVINDKKEVVLELNGIVLKKIKTKNG